MEFKLKTISKSGIPHALEKATTFRYLSQPEETESICRDVLAVEPANQMALRLLGLAIIDQFCGESSDRYAEAERIFGCLSDPYERIYHAGVLHERKARAQLRAGEPGYILVPMVESAMACFDEASRIRPEGNDESILRWNRCVRLAQDLSRGEEETETTGLYVADGAPVA